MIVECKYRSPHKQILFLPDPNIDYSPITLGSTISVIDAAMPYYIPTDALADFERGFEFAYKGIELFEGGAVENDLRHAFQQLRYATPPMLTRILDNMLHQHPDDVVPTFFTKILVTNAPLRLLHDGSAINDIEAAKGLEEISDAIESLIFYSDYGPDFEDHFRRVFELGMTDRKAAARERRDYLTSVGKIISISGDPAELVEAYGAARRFECHGVSTQFFVTNLNGLQRLLSGIKKVCGESFRRQRKTKFSNRTRVPHRR
jgi:hypothetical protein